MSAAVATSATGTAGPTDDGDSGIYLNSACIPASFGGPHGETPREAYDSQLKQDQLLAMGRLGSSETTKDRDTAYNQNTTDETTAITFAESENVTQPLHIKMAPFASSGTAELSGNTQACGDQSAVAYPDDLRKILLEVASTGTCSWLPWDICGVNDMSAPSRVMVSRKSNYSAGIRCERKSNIRSSHKRLRKSSAALSHGLRGIGAKGGLQGKLHNTNCASRGSSTVTSTETISMEPGGDSVNQATSDQDTAIWAYRNGSSSNLSVGSGGNRKRPLIFLRTQSGSTHNTPTMFSPGSVGSGRTSGSEHEDTSQYECDSEGTSATSNSEISFDRGRGSAAGNRRASDTNRSSRSRPGIARQDNITGRVTIQNSSKDISVRSAYSCLRDAFRVAVDVAIEHYFMHRGGYKLSPVESRMKSDLLKKHQTATPDREAGEKDVGPKATNANISIDTGGMPADGELHLKHLENYEDIVFRKRKNRLLGLLGRDSRSANAPIRSLEQSSPFTIQRIAEVLISPTRYYTQTHKLCNCLEKLLLVKSSAGAFGGSTGGDTSQNLKEETELAALSDEKSRLRSEFRVSQRRQRRKSVSPVSDDGGSEAASGNAQHTSSDTKRALSNEMHSDNVADEDDETEQRQGDSFIDSEASQEMLEAAARASLRSKFDHVGIDAAAINREARSIADKRSMTNSPPPPSMGLSPNPGIVLPIVHGGMLRQHGHAALSPTSPDKDHLVVRAPSPIHLSLGPSGSPPMTSIPGSHGSMPLLQMQHSAALSGLGSFQLAGYGSLAAGGSLLGHVPSPRDVDVESRSSASSDVDSESDASFDDSASDGSDSGHLYEPFTAARAMALNRMQQQQRIQSRVLTSLHLHGGTGLGDGIRPPADSEYQSGDSIDSTRAEDSGGSDSSLSDMAD
jgi:hypothetical protein